MDLSVLVSEENYNISERTKYLVIELHDSVTGK